MADDPKPLTRKISVDCTVALEVTVQYDPLHDQVDILDARPDWSRFEVGVPYWIPNHRMPSTEVSGGVIRHLQVYIPRGTELRWNPTTSQ